MSKATIIVFIDIKHLNMLHNTLNSFNIRDMDGNKVRKYFFHDISRDSQYTRREWG